TLRVARVEVGEREAREVDLLALAPEGEEEGESAEDVEAAAGARDQDAAGGVEVAEEGELEGHGARSVALPIGAQVTTVCRPASPLAWPRRRRHPDYHPLR